LNGQSISVIEWAERAEMEIPADAIKVRLSYNGENFRYIMVEGITI
jgi:tRNA A37 threonylcarbamoyladenosine biosynthesis protein TsaE